MASASPAPRSIRTAAKGKSDGGSIPVNIEAARDAIVHNYILKLVLVGNARVKPVLARSFRQSSKKQRKKRTILGVDGHS